MKGKKIYLRYLLSNILLTAVIFLAVAGAVLPQFAMREKSEQLKLAQALLESQRDWIDNSVLESETLLYNMLQQPLFGEICRFRAPYTLDQIALTQEFVRDLALYSPTGAGFSQALLFLRQSQLFLDSGNAGVDPALFYGSRFSQAQLPYAQWYSEALAKKSVSIEKIRMAGSTEDSYVLYNGRSTLFGNDILFMATFEHQPYLQFLNTSALFADSQLLVFDQSKSLLHHSGAMHLTSNALYAAAEMNNGQTIRLSGEIFTAVTASQKTLPLKAVWLVSNKTLYRQAKSTLSVLCFTGLVLLLGFLGTAAYMAYKSSRPIYDLVRKISSSDKSFPAETKNELEYISRQFDQIAGKNEDLQSQMNTHFELTKSIFFTKLLNGVSITQEEILSVSKLLGSFFSHNQYLVILIDMLPNDLNENEIVKMMLKNILREMVQRDSVVVQTGANRFCVVLAATAQDELSIHAFAEQLVHHITQSLPKDITCTVGNVCALPEQLSREYQVCCYVFDTLLTDGLAYQQQAVFVSDRNIVSKGYYFPLFEEQGLLNCISGKKYDAARAVLDKLFRQNFYDRKIPQKEQLLFLDHICSTFSRLVRSSDTYGKQAETMVEDIIYQTKHLKKGDIALESFESILDFLEKTDEKGKTNKSGLISDEIEEKIETSFSNPDFSITQLSAQMNLSENYLSVIYRQHTGGSIAATIEKTRMEYAAKQLTETVAYIKDVCEAAGYNNLNTFYKAFKRYYGVTPSDYRGLQDSARER